MEVITQPIYRGYYTINNGGYYTTNIEAKTQSIMEVITQPIYRSYYTINNGSYYTANI